MLLRDLWVAQREYFTDKKLKQVISFTGDGTLADNNRTSVEFRDFLSHISRDFLEDYARQCLTPFENSGLALQDIVNQVGERLEFEVEYGRYKGVRGELGFDGLWQTIMGHTIIVEVKTTDTYRIDLGKLSAYKKGLIDQGKIQDENSSILIIVGRQDTGDLESQIRGSRSAWDTRLISIEALLHLLRLKEEVDDPRIVAQIHSILVPHDFARLDSIVEILFLTAEAISQETPIDELSQITSPVEATSVPQSFHERCISKVETRLGVSLVRRSRTGYSSPNDSNISVICLVSKDYNRELYRYWFGFRDYQKEFLDKASQSYVALGCNSEATLLLIPYVEFIQWLDRMNVSEEEHRSHWHVHISEKNGKYLLLLKGRGERVDVTHYLI